MGSANLFDLLMLKLGQVYQRKGTNAKIESKGPRFEIKDFVVKLGSVTTAGSFKGILVEVEYCPCLVPDNCWSLLAEFMQASSAAASQAYPRPTSRRRETQPSPQRTLSASTSTTSISLESRLKFSKGLVELRNLPEKKHLKRLDCTEIVETF